MHRRSVVAYVGDDTDVRDRVRDAVATAWNGPRSPDYEAVTPAELAAVAEGPSPLDEACGVVTTIDALSSDAVRGRLTASPDSVPILVAVRGPGIDTLRTVLDANADDAVAIGPDVPSGEERGEISTDPLVERLREAIDPARLGSDGVARGRDVLLDAGTTLMSTRSDEVETKIVWTMENVGRQVSVDRIVCYLEEGDAFEPAYHWSSGECAPVSMPFRSSPTPRGSPRSRTSSGRRPLSRDRTRRGRVRRARNPRSGLRRSTSRSSATGSRSASSRSRPTNRARGLKRRSPRTARSAT